MKIKVASHIESIVPYPPGKPLEELEREYGITGSIKLASNENAWGPSPKAMAAISRALANLHRYPDGSCHYLAEKLAEKLGVKTGEIVFGNGSNEVIGFLVTALVAPGDEVITSRPTFLMYRKLVQVQGGITRVVPMQGMHHDLAGILAAITEKTRLIFLDNPNNPCGTVIEKQAFEDFLAQVPEQVVVVLDEAYIDFVDPAVRLDGLSYLPGRQNKKELHKTVVILRTFSKAYGLAGLRVGFGVMDGELAGFLHRVRQPFNVNTLAQVGALAGLADEEHYRTTIDGTAAGMEWLSQEVARLGCVPLASQTNFFLINVRGNGKELYERMLRKGVIVRPMQAYGFPDHIRITVGMEAENQRFIKALAESLQELGYV
ncbi:MAG: histidinol-phosphate transaminase [Desulfobacterales bacterium]|nr:histidinol-phosphate transaminase [Desulfobacterales bacterium]